MRAKTNRVTIPKNFQNVFRLSLILKIMLIRVNKHGNLSTAQRQGLRPQNKRKPKWERQEFLAKHNLVWLPQLLKSPELTPVIWFQGLRLPLKIFTASRWAILLWRPLWTRKIAGENVYMPEDSTSRIRKHLLLYFESILFHDNLSLLYDTLCVQFFYVKN